MGRSSTNTPLVLPGTGPSLWAFFTAWISCVWKFSSWKKRNHLTFALFYKLLRQITADREWWRISTKAVAVRALCAVIVTFWYLSSMTQLISHRTLLMCDLHRGWMGKDLSVTKCLFLWFCHDPCVTLNSVLILGKPSEGSTYCNKNWEPPRWRFSVSN